MHHDKQKIDLFRTAAYRQILNVSCTPSRYPFQPPCLVPRQGGFKFCGVRAAGDIKYQTATARPRDQAVCLGTGFGAFRTKLCPVRHPAWIAGTGAEPEKGSSEKDGSYNVLHNVLRSMFLYPTAIGANVLPFRRCAGQPVR